MHLIKGNHHGNGRVPVALFDASHGQPNWAQTGFPSREMHSNYLGLTEILCHLGFHCRSTGAGPLNANLASSRLVIIPPPMRRYDARRERWRHQKTSLFSPEEVGELLSFLNDGGRLLAFAYRFGDSFTQTNLGDLCLALGCRLNDDAVIDVRALRQTHPLHLHFDTPAESLPLKWSRTEVTRVCWRPCSTFTIAPGATARPLALSTGGGCLSFNRTLRRICFESLPIAVVGRHGGGRFALFGGPHVFESSPLGLLAKGDNTRFLDNLLTWLLDDGTMGTWPEPEFRELVGGLADHALTLVNGHGDGERTVASVERVLRKTGVLKALSQAKWLP